MGESRSRKLAAQRAKDAVGKIDKNHVFEAVRLTMDAFSNLSGADCLGFSLVGTGLFKSLGIPARFVAGHASWRVGPGDGDMIVHDPNANASAVHIPQGQASMFHAWIEIDAPDGLKIVDFTTFQLKDKAAALDAVDGGKTQVDFCPDFLWQDAPVTPMTTEQVTQAPNAGVYSYKRSRAVESLVFVHSDNDAVFSAIRAASFAYQRIALGEPVKVIGIDPQTGEMQTEAPKISQRKLN